MVRPFFARERFAPSGNGFDRVAMTPTTASMGESRQTSLTGRSNWRSPNSPFIELSHRDLEQWVKDCREADLSRPKPEKVSKTETEVSSGAWVGKATIARHFGVSVRTIEAWLVNGMPCARPSSRMVRFRIADCETWYQQQYRMQSRPSAYRPRRIHCS